MSILNRSKLAIVFVSAIEVYSSNAASQEVHWHKSAPKAVDAAHRSGRKILISVGAEWCGFCKKMDREVWQDRLVSQAVTTNFIPLKLTDEEHKAPIESLDVQAFPTIFVFTTDRKLLARMEGFVDSEQMLDALNRIHSATKERIIPER